MKLYADNHNALEITIQNNGKEPLELPYRVTPSEHFVVELQGENGKQFKIQHTGEKVGKAEPGTLTVPAGKSRLWGGSFGRSYVAHEATKQFGALRYAFGQLDFIT